MFPGPFQHPILNLHECDARIVFLTRNTSTCITSHHITLLDVHHMCSTSHQTSHHQPHHITSHQITSHHIAQHITLYRIKSHRAPWLPVWGLAFQVWRLGLRVDSASHLITAHFAMYSTNVSIHTTSHRSHRTSHHLPHHITSQQHLRNAHIRSMKSHQHIPSHLHQISSTKTSLATSQHPRYVLHNTTTSCLVLLFIILSSSETPGAYNKRAFEWLGLKTDES